MPSRHYLRQCCSKFPSLYGVIRSQRVKFSAHHYYVIHYDGGTWHKKCARFCYVLCSGNFSDGFGRCIYQYSSGLLHYYCDNREIDLAPLTTHNKTQQTANRWGVYFRWTISKWNQWVLIPLSTMKIDDMMTSSKWKHFPCNWNFVRGIHRSPVNTPHKGQWRGALIISLICAWING